jgi:hypothetical protein
VSAAEQLPETQPPERRRAIPATCTTHGGTPGHTNLVASKRSGHVEFDPHVDRLCMIMLDEDETRVLRKALQERLG